MDFRFRPEDRNVSSPYFFPPNSSNNNYFTEQAMRAGYFNNGFIRTDFFSNTDPVREAVQREIEKERIREEIIAAELIRKRELEAEVRREMAMERELGFPLLSNSFHFQHSLNNNLNLNNQAMDTSSRVHDRFSISLRPEVGSFDRLPFQRHPEAVKITELKPAVPSITGIKRKITAIGVSGFALGNSKKKPQKEWSCALCRVSATSEKGLDSHLQGRKHKAKELGLMRAKGAISLEIDGSGVSKNSDEQDLANASSSSILGQEEEKVPAKKMNDKESMQKDEAANEQKQNDQPPGEKDEDDEAVLNLRGVENKDIESSITLPEKPEGSKINSRCNLIGGEMPVKAMKSENDGEETLQNNQNPEDVKKKFKFWCKHCQIGCRNAINMADHERGKKHIAQIQTLKQNSEDVKLAVRKNVAVVQKKQKTEDFKKQFKYWCEQCQVGCKSEKTLVNHEKGKKHMARLPVAEQDVGVVQASDANIGNAEAVEVEATQNVYGKEKTPATTTTIAVITDATGETSNEEVMENIDGEVDGKKEALTTTTTVAAVTAATSEMPEEEVMGNIGGEVNEQDALADTTTMTHVTDATGETLKEEMMGNIGREVKEQETLADITTMPIITDARCQMSNEELMEIVGGKGNNQEALTTDTITTSTTISDAIFEVANEEVTDFLLMEVNGEGGDFELKASVEDMTEGKVGLKREKVVELKF